MPNNSKYVYYLLFMRRFHHTNFKGFFFFFFYLFHFTIMYLILSVTDILCLILLCLEETHQFIYFVHIILKIHTGHTLFLINWDIFMGDFWKCRNDNYLSYMILIFLCCILQGKESIDYLVDGLVVNNKLHLIAGTHR